MRRTLLLFGVLTIELTVNVFVITQLNYITPEGDMLEQMCVAQNFDVVNGHPKQIQNLKAGIHGTRTNRREIGQDEYETILVVSHEQNSNSQ